MVIPTAILMHKLLIPSRDRNTTVMVDFYTIHCILTDLYRVSTGLKTGMRILCTYTGTSSYVDETSS